MSSSDKVPIQVAVPVDLLSSSIVNIPYSSISFYQPSSIFEWSAFDNPSEMNYNISACEIICCCFCMCPIFLPCVPFMIMHDRNIVKSQKIMITDTHFDFEHEYDSIFCCFTYSPTKYHISLDKVLFITTRKWGYNNIYMSCQYISTYIEVCNCYASL